MSAPTIGYTILLMNTGKDGPGPSPAAKRQEAFTEVVKRVKPSLIFTQECTGPFVKGLGAEYVKLGIPEAGFIFNVNEFTFTDYTQDTDLANLVNTLTKEKKISGDFQFLGRVRVVKFTSRGVPNLEILALSGHGQYSKLNDTTKIRLLKERCVVVKEMRKLEKLRDKRGNMLPVIIGGDFNIEVTKWLSDPDLVNHMYTPSERRKGRLIDLFVSTKDLMVKDSKFVTMNFELKDGSNAADLFKHDPVQGVLSYSTDKSQSSKVVSTKRDNTATKKGKAANCVDVPAKKIKLAKSADKAPFGAGNCGRGGPTGSSGSTVNSADRAPYGAGNCGRGGTTGSSGSTVNSADRAPFGAGNCGRGGPTGSSGSTEHVRRSSPSVVMVEMGEEDIDIGEDPMVEVLDPHSVEMGREDVDIGEDPMVEVFLDDRVLGD